MLESVNIDYSNLDWLEDRTIILSPTGSYAYGTNTEESDRDYKGVCIPPIEYYFGLESFNEYNNSGGKNFKNTKDDVDVNIIHINKFVKDAIQGVPNNIEILFVRPEDYLKITPLGHVLIDNRHLFLSKQIHKRFGGYAYSQIQKLKNKKSNGTGRIDLVEKFGYDCYSIDTEFLTNRGWKRYDEIEDNDFLATVNPHTKEIEFQKPVERVRKHYSGVMYEVDARFSNCLVTPNHRMFVSSVYSRNKRGSAYDESLSNWQFNSIENLVSGERSAFHILTAPKPKRESDSLEMSKNYLTLVGLFLSEGTINFRKNKNRKTPKSIRITQTQKGKQEVFELMDSISDEYEFKRYDYSRETVWISHNKDLVEKIHNECGHSDSKKIPDWAYGLSGDSLDVLLHALYLGDGTVYKAKNKRTGIVYYTSNKNLADGVQALAIISGRDSNLRRPSSGYQSISSFTKNEITMYQVFIKDGLSQPKCVYFKELKENSKDRRGIKKVLYNDDIVCFTVHNENLITRRKGKVAIQGNTKFFSHSVRLLTSAIEILETGDFSTYRPNRELLLDCRNGKYTFEEALEMVNYYDIELKKSLDKSELPSTPSYKEINDLLIELNYLGMTTL